ncbi:hypothetical protein [Caulobacter sp. SSI4214]|uniref:hypothetical protein n=1 Tax=Caulobacter sp. SSI4214 TaxID=2575739 RepID=UPI001438BECB|nr:hypothetical protein [Caulobacter sp. SSI4214]
MTDLIVNWVQTPTGDGWDVEPDAEVWVSVAAIEASFRRGDQWVGPGGAGAGQPSRYARMGETILSGIDIWMPYISLDASGEVRFTDGRHRFAWVRDHGAEAIMISTGPGEVAEWERRYGTTARVCKVMLPLARG